MFILDVASEALTDAVETATQAASAIPFDFYDKIKVEDESVIGRLLTGLQVTVIGMAVVFSVLILLWGILELFGLIVASMTKNKEPAAEISEPAVEDENETSSGYAEDDGVLIAVLTAAVIEYNKTNGNNIPEDQENKGFRIVSFKERNKII